MEATSARRLPCHQTCKATFLSPSLSRCVASENVISVQQKQQQQQQRRRRQLSNNTCIATHTKYINGAALTPIGTCSFSKKRGARAHPKRPKSRDLPAEGLHLRVVSSFNHPVSIKAKEFLPTESFHPTPRRPRGKPYLGGTQLKATMRREGGSIVSNI